MRVMVYTATVSAFYKLDLHFPHCHLMDHSMGFHYPKGLLDGQMDHGMGFHYPKGLLDGQMDYGMGFHYPKGLLDGQMDHSMGFHYPKGLLDGQMDHGMGFHYPKGLLDGQVDHSMVFVCCTYTRCTRVNICTFKCCMGYMCFHAEIPVCTTLKIKTYINIKWTTS